MSLTSGSKNIAKVAKKPGRDGRKAPENTSFQEVSGKAAARIRRKPKKKPFNYTYRLPPKKIWGAFFLQIFTEEMARKEEELLAVAGELAGLGKGRFPEANRKEDGNLVETSKVISLVKSTWQHAIQTQDAKGDGAENDETERYNLLKSPKMGEEARAYLNAAMNKVRAKFLARAEKLCIDNKKMTLTSQDLVMQLCVENGVGGMAKLMELALPAQREVIQYYENNKPKREVPAAFGEARRIRAESRKQKKIQTV